MSDDTIQQGYRLETLEVFNWGTFNGLYRLQTDTHTALLTGKNGSGKSTLVDALLTLLVPSRGTGGRNYNQAAGTSGKERSETSYVRGAYTQRTDPTTGKTQTQYLRDEKSYSVLLAVFYNPALDKTVTLAIVFWMSSGSLSKFYVVADCALTCPEHFQVEGNIGRTLRRKLNNMDDVQVFNTFTQYSANLTRKLHLGEKAITLFNQIVSIKDIAGLNDFVRQHMLEEYDSQKAIDDLRGYYDNLTTAYEAIEKAEKQLAYLDPLLNVIRRHSDQQGRIIETNEKIDAVEIYISAIQRDLLAVEIKALEEQIQEATIAAEKTAQALTSLNAQRRELERDIDKDDMGQRLQRLKDALKDLQHKQSERQRQQQKYAKSARGVDLTVPDSVLIFDKNRELAQNKLHIIKDEIDDLVRKRVNIR
ncbi:MAG: ATP-binding protein, partial [Chloroflexota bacterium]